MFVVHAAVAAGDGFYFVVEVDDDFVERQAAGEHDASGIEAFGVLKDAAFFQDELHERTNIFVGDHDEGLDDGFADFLDDAEVGEVLGVIDEEDFAVGAEDFVDDARVGGDDVHVVFAAEAFLDDFHVEEAEEAATEAEPEGDGAFGYEAEGGVVELEFAHGDFEGFEVGGVDGVDARKDHRVDDLEAGQRDEGGEAAAGEGVADFDLGGVFDVGDDVADVARAEARLNGHFGVAGAEDADFFDVVAFVGGHRFDVVTCGDAAIDDADVNDDAAVGVEGGVEDESAEFFVGRVDGGRDAGDDGFEDVVDADAGFGAGWDGFFAGDGEDFFELLANGGEVGVGQVDFVDDGDEGEALFHREVDVGDGLGFDSLCSIDDQEGAFAGGEGAGDFVGEIDMPRGVHEVEFVDFTGLGLVLHRDRMRFDGDAALAFEVHGVEHLILLLADLDGAGVFEEAVGEGGLAVVDVGNDAEITSIGGGHGKK